MLAYHSVILQHFTDFAQLGHDFTDSPARCLVRYRVGGDGWNSFWERKRSFNELNLERDYTGWENDDILKKPGHAETYVMQRLIYSIAPSDVFAFQSNRYYFICQPAAIHCHYGQGKINTLQNPLRTTVKCKYPQNVMYDQNKMFNCYHPSDVVYVITDERYGLEKELPIKELGGLMPETITFDNLSNGVSYFSKLFNSERDWYEDLTNYNPSNRMEVEIYLNVSPCQNCFDELMKFEKKYPNVFIHVKYATFYDNPGGLSNDREKEWHVNSLYDRYNYVNENPGIRLKITPFNDSDWRTINRQLNILATQQK